MVAHQQPGATTKQAEAQPRHRLSHTVTASITYNYSLYYIRVQHSQHPQHLYYTRLHCGEGERWCLQMLPLDVDASCVERERARGREVEWNGRRKVRGVAWTHGTWRRWTGVGGRSRIKLRTARVDVARGRSVSHYHTPSRERMAHTLTLLTRVRVRRVPLDQGKYRVEGGVFYLLR